MCGNAELVVEEVHRARLRRGDSDLSTSYAICDVSTSCSGAPTNWGRQRVSFVVRRSPVHPDHVMGLIDDGGGAPGANSSVTFGRQTSVTRANVVHYGRLYPAYPYLEAEVGLFCELYLQWGIRLLCPGPAL